MEFPKLLFPVTVKFINFPRAEYFGSVVIFQTHELGFAVVLGQFWRKLQYIYIHIYIRILDVIVKIIVTHRL